MVWNDDRVEQLKKLWADGLSASQIAAQLGEVTRNAVIGKVHRLGLATRASSNRTNSSRLRLRQAQPRRQVQRQRVSHVGNTAFRQMLEADHSHVGHTPVVEEIEIPRGGAQDAPATHRVHVSLADRRSADGRLPLLRARTRLPAYLTARATPAAPISRRSRAAATATSSMPALPASVTAPKEPVGT